MSFGIYIAGYIILIIGLAIIHGVRATRHKDPPS